jgi:hypothetical protein
MEVSGHLHASVALPPRNQRCHYPEANSVDWYDGGVSDKLERIWKEAIMALSRMAVVCNCI